ncbi:hypothetical protein ACQUQU_03440 [Thalassolituus sp. LLYu03]|uniref:hypothetical protein n=1 Tax=Thalassolituus sp. LLYu03 TaxID=3421656 RepID=UPI003D2D3E1F
MFECLPRCELSQLTLTDGLWLAAFGVCVYVASRQWQRWAFSRHHHAPNDLRWHLPRFIYIAFVTIMLTSVPAYTFLGADTGYWYSRTLLWPTIAIAYVAWLLVDASDPRKK